MGAIKHRKGHSHMTENKILLAFYGDDFTGSTDAMEAISKSGYRTVLFLKPPSKEMLGKFQGISCIGVAGTSRAKSPEEMERELRPVMEKLADSGARVIHYKTCSTFDSAPEVGSIGKAIEVSRDYFKEQKAIPLIVGAPQLGRYTLFGNHFAQRGEEVYRLDRHPVMSRHPITPMAEADLRLHLSNQIEEKIGLVTIVELEMDYSKIKELYQAKIEEENNIILFDVLDEERLEKASRLVWETAKNTPQLVIGSSGVEYGLAAHWEESLENSHKTALQNKSILASDTILVVSGSASAVTKEQIEHAMENGFYGFKVPIEVLLGKEEIPRQFLKEPIERLQNGQSTILYTALGPDDRAISETRNYLKQNGMAISDSGDFIGKQLGRWTKYIMQKAKISRMVIAGGDTSGFVAREMEIYGLEMILSVSPGAPLCTVYSENEEMNGSELALKGGQFGGVDYFNKVKDAATG